MENVQIVLQVLPEKKKQQLRSHSAVHELNLLSCISAASDSLAARTKISLFHLACLCVCVCLKHTPSCVSVHTSVHPPPAT